MKINRSKCSFLVNKLIFLGNLITPQGIGPDPKKVSAMLQYPAPTVKKNCAAIWDYFSSLKSLFQYIATRFRRLTDFSVKI